ncbi:MAG: replication factor C large subunit [Thermoplasmata archaeon]
MQTNNWTETHRPRKLSEIAGNSNAIRQLKSWADSWVERKPKKKGAILVGPPGIGKTSAAFALASDYEWDIVELNASDQRNAEVIDRIVGHGSRADTFSSDGNFRPAASGKLKLIVFDEADNLFGREDQGGAGAIVRSLRDAEQPIVLIVNDYYELTRRAAGIKQLAITIRFSAPSVDDIVSVLERIARKENLSISHEILYKIAKNAGKDIRAAVNDLQSLSFLSDEELESATESLGWRDVPPEMFDALKEVFCSNDPKKARIALVSLDETPDRTMLWVDDNLSRVIRDPVDRFHAIDALARADVFLGRVSRRQYFGLWSYATDLMSMGVSIAAGEKCTVYSDSIRFPEYLMALSRSKAKKKSIEALVNKASRGFHTSPSIARESVVPYLRALAIVDTKLAIAIARELELDAGELALLLDVEPDSALVEKVMAGAAAEAGEIETPTEKKEDEDRSDDLRQRSLFEFR